MKRCPRCHQVMKHKPTKNGYGQDICPYCEYVEGDCIAPSTWACKKCGEVLLDQGVYNRLHCPECKTKLICVTAEHSRVSGAGTGDPELELGLELLIEVQEADLNLGTELLRDAQNDN